MSLLAAVPGEFFSPNTASGFPWWFRWPGRSAQSGDLLVVRFCIPNYRVPVGRGPLDAPAVSIPEGWVWVGSQVRESGGDPDVVPWLMVWLARRGPAPAAPFLEVLVDEPAPREFVEPQWPWSFGLPWLWHFRGEQSISQAEPVAMSPYGAYAPPPPHPPSGPGTVVSYIDDRGEGKRSQWPHQRIGFSTAAPGESGFQPDAYGRVVSPLGTPDPMHVVQLLKWNVGGQIPEYFQFMEAWELWPNQRLWAWTLTAVPGVKPRRPEIVGAPMPDQTEQEASPEYGWLHHHQQRRVPASFDLSWRYVPGLVGPQTGVAIRRKAWWQSGYQWLAADGSWTASETVIPTSTASRVISGLLTPSTTSLWVAVQAGGVLSQYSAPLHVVRHAPATLSAFVSAAVDGPSVTTLTDTLTPWLRMTAAAGAGATLSARQIEVVDTASGAVHASVTDADFGPWRITPPLENLRAYRVRVRVAQNDDDWTEWVEASVTTDLPVPDDLALTATLGAHATSGAPGVVLHVTCPTWADAPIFDWSPEGVVIEVQRSADGGASWVAPGEHPSRKGAIEWELTDYGPPSGVPLLYRVRARVPVEGGGWAHTAWAATTAAVSLTAATQWLIDPTRPEWAVRLREFNRELPARDSGARPHDVLGQDRQEVAYGTPRWGTGKVSVRAFSLEEHDALMRLLESQGLLLHRGCVVRSLRDDSRRQEPDVWMRVVGQITPALGWQGPTQWRNVEVEYAVAADPAEPVA